MSPGRIARTEEADLGEPALAGAPEELELDHAVLGRRVALREAERRSCARLAADDGGTKMCGTPHLSRTMSTVAAWSDVPARDHDGGKDHTKAHADPPASS